MIAACIWPNIHMYVYMYVIYMYIYIHASKFGFHAIVHLIYMQRYIQMSVCMWICTHLQRSYNLVMAFHKVRIEKIINRGLAEWFQYNKIIYYDSEFFSKIIWRLWFRLRLNCNFGKCNYLRRIFKVDCT